MPYIIKDAKVVFAHLGSAEFKEADCVWMTEKQAIAALASGVVPTSTPAQEKAKDLETFLSERQKRERDEREARAKLQRAENKFKMRLASGAVSREEVMALWKQLHNPDDKDSQLAKTKI